MTSILGIQTCEWIEKYPDAENVLETELEDMGVPEKTIKHCKIYCQCDGKTVYFSPNGVSKLLNISRNNVQNRIRSGKTFAIKDMFGYCLVPMDEIHKLAEKYGVRKEAVC